jgi:amidophosphoribosyltransferase
LIAEAGLFAFRDPYGIRPLMLGKKNNRYMVASETIPFSFLGYEYVRDLMPGELLFIDQKMQIHSKRLEKKDPKPCMFEWVYFAGAEGEIESVAVYTARLALGRSLAEQIKEKIESGEIEADLVAPVPDTSRTAATALAESLQLPYREVLIKNRYIKRTFILNSKQKRERAVDLKLNPVVSQLKGKNIILVDDSIVRGTTSKKIIELVRRAGAKKVYFVSTCPPIRFPCFYGIDFPDQNELVAANRNAEEIALQLGADLVVYQNLPGLLKALEPPLASNQRFEPCLACLNGKYPTDVRESSRFTQLRNSERVKFEISESRSKPQASL